MPSAVRVRFVPGLSFRARRGALRTRHLGGSVEAMSPKRDARHNHFDLTPLEPRRLMAVAVNIPGVPALSSRSGATAKLYLDFNGSPAQTWGTYNVPATPAYDTDGNPDAFSTGEISAIREIWARVAEKYSPFNLNVTTVDPGNLADRVTMKSVIGGDGAWTGMTGRSGVAFPGAFANSANNTAFTFSKTFASDRRAVAESIAHEAGHGFGLVHQAVYDAAGNRTAEYNQGNASIAPIMGTSFYAARGLWWSGPTTSATTIQNDLAILSNSTNGFGYRADDHGSTGATATTLTRSGSSLSGKGVIEKYTDVDLFKFTTGGGSITLNANVVSAGPTLDLRLVVHNGSGAKVASADTSALGESVTFTGGAGTYYVTVYSKGANVGDVGQFTISGTASAPTTTTTSGSISGINFLDTDGDGVRDGGEGALSGKVFYIDANKNGVLDTGERKATTDAAGTYRFTNLPTGIYRIRRSTGTGWRVSTPSSGYFDVALASGQVVTGKNFGITQKILISGNVFNDANGDRLKNSGELGLSSWRVFIDADSDGLWDSTEKYAFSDGSGNYSFKTLSAGTYKLRVVQQSGWTRTTPTAGYHSVTLSAGQTATGKLFGERRIV
jgi:hypothetical protein